MKLRQSLLHTAALDRPALTIVLCLVAVLAAGAGVRQLDFTNDARVFFDPDNPERVAFEALERSFDPTQNVLLVVAPGEGARAGVLSPQGFVLLGDLVARARALPDVESVLAPTNLPVPRVAGDGLAVSPLVADPTALTVAQAAERAARALAEPALRNRLLSSDGRVAAASINLRLPPDEPGAVDRAVAAVRALAAELRADYPSFTFYLAGPVLGGVTFGEAAEADIRTIMPLVAGIVTVLLLVLFRSITATVGTLIVVAAAAAFAMGIAGWLGMSLNSASAGAPAIIMTLAVADSIHLITGTRQARARGLAKRAAIRESLRLNLGPIFLTSATTATGFLSMNAAGSPPLRDLGNVSALGVAAAFVFSVTLLPAALALLPMAARTRPPGEQVVMARLGAWLVARRWPVFGASVAAALALAAGMERITLDDRFVTYFDERFELRRDSDFVERNLTGLAVIEHALPAGAPGAVADDDYLAMLDGFGAWYRTQPGVVHVHSLAELARRLNRAFHDDDPAADLLPGEPGLARRQLTSFTAGLPDDAPAFDLVDGAFATSRLIATVRGQTSAELRALAAAADAWLAANAPDHAAPATSFSLMFAHLSARSIENMLRSTSIALVVISLLLIIALRSVPFGFLSLAPNLVPAAIGLGLWGWVHGNLGLASSVVMAMTLGIVVDNTIHLLSKYLRARRLDGLRPEPAAIYAFETTGGALALNTIVLASGFAALTVSGFAVTAQLGALTAIVLAVALVADFLLLPALMVGRRGRR